MSKGLLNKAFEDFAASLPTSCDEALNDWRNFFDERISLQDIEVWRDLNLIPNFSANSLEWTYQNWEPKSTDILTILGIKTGTTWLREIVRQILYGKDQQMLDKTRAIDYYLTYLEMGNNSKWKIWDSLDLPRRYLQCHMPPSGLSMDKMKKCKIIFLKRNFKDQLVSFYYFCQQLPIMTKKYPHYYAKNWDTFFDQHMKGTQPINQKLGETFLDFELEWEPYLKWNNILTTSYEDLKQDLPGEVKRISEHIGMDLSAEDINRVSAACSMQTMKASTVGPLIRKGIVGDWKNHFTVAQSELVDDVMRKKGMKLIT